MARVTPVYKKKDASLPENYRPISVLPTLATTLERVLMKQLGIGNVDVGVILADTMSLALEVKRHQPHIFPGFKEPGRFCQQG